jgi:hypothetical protein
MGYTAPTLRRLRRHRDRVAGKDVLTLGVLHAYLSETELRELDLSTQATAAARAARQTPAPAPSAGGRPQAEPNAFSAAFLGGELGARAHHALDVDAYQGAELICNLNHPMDEALRGRYDLILDLGTLEHLSNLSTALHNLFGMLKDGGSYFFALPCNQWVDHGFFQFSPTFFVDLCHHNPHLQGTDFALLVGGHEIPLAQFDKYVRKAVLRSGLPLIFCGLITRQPGAVDLDLVQSKYRGAYTGLNTSPDAGGGTSPVASPVASPDASSGASRSPNPPASPAPLQPPRRRAKWRNALSQLPGLSLSIRLALLRAGL